MRAAHLPGRAVAVVAAVSTLVALSGCSDSGEISTAASSTTTTASGSTASTAPGGTSPSGGGSSSGGGTGSGGGGSTGGGSTAKTTTTVKGPGSTTAPSTTAPGTTVPGGGPTAPGGLDSGVTGRTVDIFTVGVTLSRPCNDDGYAGTAGDGRDGGDAGIRPTWNATNAAKVKLRVDGWSTEIGDVSPSGSLQLDSVPCTKGVPIIVRFSSWDAAGKMKASKSASVYPN